MQITLLMSNKHLGLHCVHGGTSSYPTAHYVTCTHASISIVL